jgi:transcription elongation factor SPT5
MDSPQENPPATLAAFELSTVILGSIYVEAKSPNDALMAIRDLNGVPKRPRIDFVSLEERSALLGCQFKDIEAGTWVRISRGRYRNDLAYVQCVNGVENEATVLLVPRLSPDGVLQAGKASRKEKEKVPARVRPHPCLFNPPPSGASCRRLDDGRVEFKGQVFRCGLLEMNLSYHRLMLASPTAEELDVFGRSHGVEASVIGKSWSNHSVTALTPDAVARIVSGEQSGLVGEVLNIAGDICQFRSLSPPQSIIDVHLSNIRIHFNVGDYVRVKAGIFVGSVGWVTQVEQRPDVDIVTFIDEAMIKKGEAKEVSIFRRSLQHYI